MSAPLIVRTVAFPISIAPLVPSAILAIATTFVFRLLAILFDWKTKSVMRPCLQAGRLVHFENSNLICRPYENDQRIRSMARPSARFLLIRTYGQGTWQSLCSSTSQYLTDSN